MELRHSRKDLASLPRRGRHKQIVPQEGFYRWRGLELERSWGELPQRAGSRYASLDHGLASSERSQEREPRLHKRICCQGKEGGMPQEEICSCWGFWTVGEASKTQSNNFPMIFSQFIPKIVVLLDSPRALEFSIFLFPDGDIWLSCPKLRLEIWFTIDWIFFSSIFISYSLVQPSISFFWNSLV